jgi:hypothetical protein
VCGVEVHGGMVVIVVMVEDRHGSAGGGLFCICCIRLGCMDTKVAGFSKRYQVKFRSG